MQLHVHMRLHVRRGLFSSCNQRTRSGCRARLVGYERLEAVNDCRFLHYWKLSISPGRYMYRNGGVNEPFIACNFCQANRSQPPTVHILQKCPGAGPRRPCPGAPGPGTANPDNKKGAHGSFESRAPPTCAFSCCSHTRQNQQARSSRTTATKPTTQVDAMLQSRLKPMWPTEPQSRSAPDPALAGPAGPRSASL